MTAKLDRAHTAERDERGMMHGAVAAERRRELAHRVSGGVEVTLHWDADQDTTSIEIWQRAPDETLAFAVPREQALDAFYHPFAHVPAGFAHLPHDINR